jgi:hypothetical protein
MNETPASKPSENLGAPALRCGEFVRPLKRFSSSMGNTGMGEYDGDPYPTLEPNDEGEWVKAEEHEAAVAQLVAAGEEMALAIRQVERSGSVCLRYKMLFAIWDEAKMGWPNVPVRHEPKNGESKP